MSNQYLFLFTIGPVQSFIAQARKSRDLYAGSKILSELIETGLKKVKELDTNSKIIFPNEDIPSKPNRFIAKVTVENIKDFAQEIKSVVENKFKNYAKNAYSNVFGSLRLTPEIKKQLTTFLDIHWTAIPLGNYNEDFNSLENHLEAIKKFRNFSQLDEVGRKCSLCGERNVHVYRKKDKESKNKYPQEAFEIKDCSYLFNPGEGLCSVCFTKRMFEVKKKISFESTADIAIADVVSFLQNDIKGKEIYNFYKSYYNPILFDGQLLFKENLNIDYFEKHGLGISSIQNLKHNIPDAYMKGKNFLKENSLIITPYNVAISFDGDSMGEHLSGKYLKDRNKMKEYHFLLSSSLGILAGKVNKYFDSNESIGQAIYAGGDDFFGFINIRNLFSTLKKIHELFEENVNDKVNNFITNKLTFSAGIVITHYKTPLSEVLSWTIKSEKQAKDLEGKDGYCFTILKHSGEINSFKMKWNINEFNTIDFFEKILSLLDGKVFCQIFGCPKEIQKVKFENGKPVFERDKNGKETKEYDKEKPTPVALKDEKGKGQEYQGKIIFFDAFPTKLKNESIKVDIMNPHYGAYYESDTTKEVKPPGDYYNPVPIPFLTIQDTTFQFIIGEKFKSKNIYDKDDLESQKLILFSNDKGQRVSYFPNMDREKIVNMTLLNLVYEWLHLALTEHGIGAKTAVGYGYMK
jgi:CRISPR-associated protein Cmr2